MIVVFKLKIGVNVLISTVSSMSNLLQLGDSGILSQRLSWFQRIHVYVLTFFEGFLCNELYIGNRSSPKI